MSSTANNDLPTEANDQGTQATEPTVTGTATIAAIAPEQAKKKRRSDIQLNKDDHPEGGCSDDDGEFNDDGEKRSDPFKRAPEEVLKERKIVKVSKKWDKGSTAGGTGAFAGVTLVAPDNKADDKQDEVKKSSGTTSVFGSVAKVPTFGSVATSTGFSSTFGSGFGAVSNGFGSIKATPEETDNDAKNTVPKSTFGSGFGTVSSGFGGAKSTSVGFGKDKETKDNQLTGGTFTASAVSSEIVKLQSTEVNNGEEDEDCVYEVRAKLFKLAPVVDVVEGETENETKGESVPSVPSTSGRMELKKDDEKKEETDKKKDAKGANMEWKEVGIGPVRILKRKSNPLVIGKESMEEKKDDTKPHARIVQRRETTPGGQGTKLILNVSLIPDVCKVIRTSEKTIQLSAPNCDEDGSGRALGSYSFRVKTTADADSLQSSLKQLLAP